MARIAINGFGRIGRLFFRSVFSRSVPGEQNDIEIVAVNDLGDIENLAYLLKYDTVYGRFRGSVEIQDGNLVVNGKTVRVLQVKDPAELPWKEFDVDVAVEATGVFETYEKARTHLTAGAKRVVLTAPARDADGVEGKTVLVGVNDGEFEGTILTSNGSCTTNAAAPVIQIMNENPGVEKAFLNTVHGYTATQNLVDGPTRGHDLRRGRAAAGNIVPSTTGAAIAVTRAIPELEGKFDGISLRVPVLTGSIADITFVAKRNVTEEEVNGIFRAAAQDPRWQGIFAVTEEQIVSSDIIGESYGSIVDLRFTKVVGGNLVKVLAWYDNEAGYVATLIKHIEAVARSLV